MSYNRATYTRFDFYPRPPRGGRPNLIEATTDILVFLSTPSARGAADQRAVVAVCPTISIHALREEGDGQLRYFCAGEYGISIHALREEGDMLSLKLP